MAYSFQPSKTVYLAQEVLSAFDTGKYSHISINEVYGHMDARDLVQWLTVRLGADIDLSLLDAEYAGRDEPDCERVTADMGQINSADQDMHGSYGGQHRRKWGIENSGLLLVASWGFTMAYDNLRGGSESEHSI